MKKIFVFIAASMVMLTACNSSKEQKNEESVDSTANVESQEVMTETTSNELDSINNAPKTVALCKEFIDFEAEYNGKVQKFSDYFKGQPVLVDFWASWCGPCRGEVPNLKKIHEKYGDKITVLGVATWDEPQETLKAIEEEGITYAQMLNAQEAGSNAYNFDGIPEIILFAPDGSIIQRGLRGAEIEKAVANLLGI